MRLSSATFILIAVCAMLAFTETSSAATPPAADGKGSTNKASGVYIVQMLDDPIVAYDGGVPGLAATKPARGEHVNPNSAAVRRYRDFLNRGHADALSAAGAPAGAKFYDYAFSFNGFAAELTPAQVQRLEAQPGVVAISPEEQRHLMTDNTPSELGLTGPTGFWEGYEQTGEDVIIGVIDSGIWPEHPSFSDQSDFAYRPGPAGNALRVYDDPPAHWNGICQSGQSWSQKACNNKLIGARYFSTGFLHQFAVPEDYLSPRDHDGHGTHTASTAGGNQGVDPSIFGRDLGVDTISGMAPRARIAAYKACFGEGGCFFTDLLAAIDAAVADGVDVINYSIGSNTPELISADAVAFLFAAEAGVFVATSAGNNGPEASTVGSPAASPWLTAVGASTHGRVFQNTVALGNGDVVTGGSVTHGVGPAPLVDGGEDCPEDLEASEVAGAIVLCLRVTGIPRLTHGEGVAAAGGVGMILYDPPQHNVTPTDNHVLPTSHVSGPDGESITDYIELTGDDATASLSAGSAAANPGAPDMAVFSSRGPNGDAEDIIKPDVTAPGTQILAGNSPTPFLGAQGELFQAIQGTSMSSPHAAGIGALLVGEHPDWSPAMIRSALVTTGSQDVDKEDGTTPADPFDFGGGHIDPFPANDPGLVYDAGLVDYLRFLCGDGELSATTATCTALGSIDPSDLNQASIGIGQLAGIQTVERTVTNVDEDATYAVSVAEPPGVDVQVDPEILTLGAGESATYEVTFTTEDATFDEWAFGSLTWSDDAGHDVRSPLAIKPVIISAPQEISATGTTGELEYEVTFGYDGPFETAVHGLIPATTEAGNVVDDPEDEIEIALETGVGITEHTVMVPAGTRHLRFATFDGETDGADDLDLYLFNPDGDRVDESAGATAQEQVDAVNPTEGEWKLVVHGWETDGADSNYTLFSWVLGDGDAGNLTVTAPAAAVLGATETITAAWSGLTAGTRYLGAISYSDGVVEFGVTLVTITG